MVGPLVSVYMPTKDRVELLARAVESVLAQTYMSLELIIVDDGSSDGTRDYLWRKAKADSRVVFFSNEHSIGACASRNIAINNAKGHFITGIDDDDYFLPNRISNFVNCWRDKHPRSIALSSNSIFKVSGAREITTNRKKATSRKDLILSNEIGNQVFAETSVILAVGAFDPRMPAWQDFDLWYRLLEKEDSQIECLEDATYVVDVSHPHERISTQGSKKISEAMTLFSRKHYLSAGEERLLKGHYFVYYPAELALSEAAALSLLSKRLSYAKHIFRIYLSGVKKRICKAYERP